MVPYLIGQLAYFGLIAIGLLCLWLFLLWLDRKSIKVLVKGRTLEPFDKKASFLLGSLATITKDPEGYCEALLEATDKNGGFALSYSVLPLIRNPEVLVVEPSLISEVLSKGITLDSSERNIPLPLWRKLFGKGIFMARTKESWKKLRRTSLRGMGSQNIPFYFPVVQSCTEKLLQAIERGAGKEGGDVEMVNLLKSFTLEIIVKVALGEDILSQREIEHITKLVNEVSENYGRLPFLFNAYVSLPFGKPRRVVLQIKELHEIVLQVVRTVKQGMQEHEEVKGDTSDKHVFGSLIRAFCRVQKEEGADGLKDIEIVHNLFAFIFAGTNTTAHTLTHLLVSMARYPDIQAKARDEIREVLGTKADIDYGKLKEKIFDLQFPYTSAVINETLRLFPPVMRAPGRNTTKKLKLGPLVVDKGTILIVPTWVFGRSKKIWGPDAQEYNPDRFMKLEGKAKSLKDDIHERVLAFGGGVRQCIGKHLSLLELKTAFIAMLARFNFSRRPELGEIDYASRHWKIASFRLVAKDREQKMRVARQNW